MNNNINAIDKTCCFTGHRNDKFSFRYYEKHPDCIRIKKYLHEEIEKAILQGFDTFVSGVAIGVDTWAAEEVIGFKEIYPDIKLECAIPCLNHEMNWPLEARIRYHKVLSCADNINYVSKQEYIDYLLIIRDKYMVDNSSRLISVFDGSDGGTKDTFDYAVKKRIEIYRLNPKTFEFTHIKKKIEEFEQLSLF